MSPEFIFNDGSINEKARNLQYVSWINFVNSDQKSTPPLFSLPYNEVLSAKFSLFPLKSFKACYALISCPELPLEFT